MKNPTEFLMQVVNDPIEPLCFKDPATWMQQVELLQDLGISCISKYDLVASVRFYTGSPDPNCEAGCKLCGWAQPVVSYRDTQRKKHFFPFYMPCRILEQLENDDLLELRTTIIMAGFPGDVLLNSVDEYLINNVQED